MNETSIGFAGFLTLIFIVLKLISVIEWSWIWVLSPLWLELLGLMLGFLLYVVIKNNRRQ